MSREQRGGGVPAGPLEPVAGDPVDEMVAGSGRIRAGFRPILGAVSALGPEMLEARARLLDRAAVEEGAAGLLPDAASPVWRCDPVPLPLPEDEFHELARGLAERAGLIEAALADLYGARRLLDCGAVPPVIALRSRAFLRASHLAVPRPRPMLDFYAADLVRAPDGAWRVAADRTARPAGTATALENRRLSRRVMPELFAGEVHAIEPFMEAWREQLRRAAPPGPARERGPGLALMTAGHRDPAWFEHVLLARELGCALVQGGDLTLRDGRLFLKTLQGLQPVDVLLNRQDPRLLDPLELDWDAHAGVPGLMSAVRAGRLAISNDPGAGFAEVAGFAAAMPAIALTLLGRALSLGAVDSRWLGDRAAREAVLARPESWRFRSAYDPAGASVRFDGLAPAARARLLARIGSDPSDFVATARVAPSTVPAVEAGRLEPAPFALRMFLLRDGEDWVAMRGGFARLLGAEEDPAGPLPRQGRGKDVLVSVRERDGGEDDARRSGAGGRAGRDGAPPAAGRIAPLVPHRAGADLPARVANDFFRLGRELERLEMRARLVRALAIRLAEFHHRPRDLVELRILAACLRPTRLVEEEKLIAPASPGLADGLSRLSLAGGGLADGVRRLGHRIELLHDRITGEMHLVLSHLLTHAHDGFLATGPGSLNAVAHATGRVLALVACLAGLAGESMVRGGGRLFLELGLRLTRAETICAEMAAAFGPANDLPSGGSGPDLETALALVLELRDSSITYRGRYLGRLELAPVLDLVLADRANPRALRSQFDAVHAALEGIDGIRDAGLTGMAAALAEAAAAVVGAPGEREPERRRSVELPARFRALAAETASLRRAIARRYIDLLPGMQAISS